MIAHYDTVVNNLREIFRYNTKNPTDWWDFSLSDKLFNLSLLTNSLADIVEFSAANFTAAYNYYLRYIGRMKREGFLNTYTVSNASYSKGFGNTAVFLGDNRTFEKLNSFSGTFLDFVVNNDSITYFERGDICLELLVYKSLNLVHFEPSSF